MTARLIFSGLADLFRRPSTSLSVILGVFATVFLCGLLALAQVGLDGALAKGQGVLRFQVYWKPGADAALTARQMDWMRALPGAIEAKAFTPEAAMAVMRGSLGGAAEPLLPGAINPLPYTLLLGFAPPEHDDAFAKMTLERLTAVDGVAEVRYNPAAIDAARSLGLLGSQAVLPLGAILALLVGLVVGNTVRLTLLRRREEFEIMRLVGAAESVIALPLVAGAAAMGFTGAGLAATALAFLWSAVAGQLAAAPLWLSLAAPPGWLWFALIAAPTAVSALAGLAAAMESRP